MEDVEIPQPPAIWTVHEVTEWARGVKLPDTTISALISNEVDGTTLITLTKPELQSELGITSLPARRYLWELIKSLEEEQKTSDHSAALQAHQEEIQIFSTSSSTRSQSHSGPDSASGGINHQTSATINAVVHELQSDAQKERQVVADHMAGKNV